MITARGRRLLVAGIALTAVGLFAGLPDAERVGVALVVLPLAARLWVRLRRPRIGVRREIVPARVAAGSPARVVLTVSNPGRLRSATARAEDTVPDSLGTAPRFTVPPLEAGGRRRAAYDLQSPIRGRFTLGPTVFRYGDPFGLCVRERTVISAGVLLVTPPVVALLPLTGTSPHTAASGGSSRSLAIRGDDDMGVRGYRQGDDLRRVHWRTTARTGQLMVRQEEQPWRHRPRLLLDTRRWTHRGIGADTSFEWAVAAAAAIGTHIGADGNGLHAVSDVGAVLADTVSGAGSATLLENLADVGPSAGASLTAGAAALGAGGGLVVAVCGAITGADLTALTRAAGRGNGIAFLLDADTWPGGTPAHGDIRTRPDLATSAEQVRNQGWIVVVVRHGDRLEDAWARAALASGSIPQLRVGT